jgi:hypothetical protein
LQAFHITTNFTKLPLGGSKWNEIEHRLFCHLTENWRGRALVTFETLIGDRDRPSC